LKNTHESKLAPLSHRVNAVVGGDFALKKGSWGHFWS